MAAHHLLCILFAALASCGVLPGACSQSSKAVAGDEVFRVTTIPFADLADADAFYASKSDELLRQAMTGDGLIAVSDIPGFALLRRYVLVASRGCVAAAAAAQSTTFPDGTARRTIATETRGLMEHRKIEFGDLAQGACPPDFIAKTDQFRALVSRAAAAFTRRMDALFTPGARPLLYDVTRSKAFGSLEQIVAGSQHLEHFHTYTRNADESVDVNADASTIDMHADQGLFIAFTPGLMVDQPAARDARATGKSPGNFYVERRDGSRVVADFGPSGDVLVFLLGDGVDQYVNPYLAQGPVLRAAPHAMVMPRHAPTEARMWYGRMFLPPSDALSESHGLSFGEVRQRAINDIFQGAGVGSGIGCSRRLLATEVQNCAANQIYCWMRCMDFTDDVNPTACEQKGAQVKCVSQQGRIWTPADSHGDYNPMCTNSTLPIVPLPTIPPRSANCAGFSEFLALDEYENSQELFEGSYYLLWNVSNGLMYGKMAYDGVAGWMALGLANPGGGANGMLGAHIVMGINDPDQELVAENNVPFIGTSVNEFIINDTATAFRHWKTPYTPNGLNDSSIDPTACFTAFTFVTSQLAGWPLSFSGPNAFIWAMHNDTYLKGYHAYGARGHLSIDFTQPYGHKTVAAGNFTAPSLVAAPPPPKSPSHGSMPFLSRAASLVSVLACVAAAGALLL